MTWVVDDSYSLSKWFNDAVRFWWRTDRQGYSQRWLKRKYLKQSLNLKHLYIIECKNCVDVIFILFIWVYYTAPQHPHPSYSRDCVSAFVIQLLWQPCHWSLPTVTSWPRPPHTQQPLVRAWPRLYYCHPVIAVCHGRQRFTVLSIILHNTIQEPRIQCIYIRLKGLEVAYEDQIDDRHDGW